MVCPSRRPDPSPSHPPRHATPPARHCDTTRPTDDPVAPRTRQSPLLYAAPALDLSLGPTTSEAPGARGCTSVPRLSRRWERIASKGSRGLRLEGWVTPVSRFVPSRPWSALRFPGVGFPSSSSLNSLSPNTPAYPEPVCPNRPYPPRRTRTTTPLAQRLFKVGTGMICDNIHSLINDFLL